MARRKIIPKRVGGVKVPKALRKMGDRILADPRSREVAGRTLLALGSALLAKGAGRSSLLRDILGRAGPGAQPAEDPGADPLRAARERGAQAAGRAGEAVGQVADAVSQAVGEVIEAIRRDFGRKVRPVRPRHAHDEHDEDGEEGPEAPADPPRPGAPDDRMH